MLLSDGLIEKILEYKANQTIHLDMYGQELKRYFQQTYNASVDLNCSGCIGRALKRIIKDLNI